MITLSLEHHDFLCAVEGFARGSHLRQHVWRDIVYANIWQMTDNDMDFLWFYMRRDLWDCYFWEDGRTRCGHEDFLHAMCALHRGNRYKVEFRSDADHRKKPHKALCYRYNGEYHPLYSLDPRKKSDDPVRPERFESYIPDEWIISAEREPMPENKHVEIGKEEWWEDLEQYAETNHKS